MSRKKGKAPRTLPPAPKQDYKQLKATWEACLFALNQSLVEKGSLTQDQLNQMPPTLSPNEPTVGFDGLEDYLKSDASNNKTRLLFIPLWVNDHWISVMLHIDTSLVSH